MPTASAVAGETFTFDAVGGADVQQEDVFAAVSKTITENCLMGYNGTIFAYGQTGSGKTFTMQGPASEEGSIEYDQRGLIPRTFEYLFERIGEEEAQSKGTIAYFCKCSYVEIYNECIFDLLDSTGTVCTLREDAKKGVFVEGCHEEVIHTPQDAFAVFEQGSRNRHVAETAMNRESSRSHCVFTLFIQSKKLEGEVLDVRESRFNLVDLAGSERQQLTATVGVRLKEAGNINKSLLALSNVINALVDIANGRPRHVHYRDSRLTFLLRDSLGGNAKTTIIAAVSPSPICQAETISTLRFAQRAKQIRNKAIVNKDVQGNFVELQSEVRRLQDELLLLKAAAAQGASAATESPADPFPHAPLARAAADDQGVYLMVRVALERQAELLAEISKQRKQIESLEELSRRKEQQINSEKMVAKFRESTIKALNAKLSEGSSAEVFEVFEAERYKQELLEVRKQLEHHPEVTRFAYENLQLRDRIKRLENFAAGLEEFDAKLRRHHQYGEELAGRLLLAEREKVDLARALAELETHNKTQSPASNEEIPTNPVRESGDALPLLAKSAEFARSSERQSRDFEKLFGEKGELESKCEDLLLGQEMLRKELEVFRAQHQKEAERKLMSASVECILSSDYDGEREESLDCLEKRRRTDGGGSSYGEDSMEELLSLQTTLNQKISSLEEQNVLLQGHLGELCSQAQLEARTAADLATELDQLKKQFKETFYTTSQELEAATLKLEEAISDKDCLDSERERLREEVERLRVSLEGTEREYRVAVETLRDAQRELSCNQGKIEQLEAEMQSLTTRLHQFEPLASYGSSTDEIVRRIEKGDERQLMMQQQISKLECMLQLAHQDNETLLSQVHELQASADREKLAQTEAMLANVSQEMEGLQEELLKLRRENDKLIQHTNVKQKLQYHLQIKEENNHFREEIRQLREELTRYGQRNSELEELLAGMGSGRARGS